MGGIESFFRQLSWTLHKKTSKVEPSGTFRRRPEEIQSRKIKTVAIVSTLPPTLQAKPRARLRTSLDAPAPLRLWHLTSLDAPTVAVVWTLAFAWVAQIRLPAWPVAVVALAAWCAYIGDRLLDARNAQTPLRARHHFHWKHRRIFLPVAFAAAIVALVLVLHSMPFAARERNSVLAAAALAYFTSVHIPWRAQAAKPWLRFPKELLVGVLFTLACAAPTLTRIAGRRTGPTEFALLATIFVFIVLAWLNCHAIEFWEGQSQQRSAVQRPANTLTAITLLAGAIAIACRSPREAALLAAAALSAAILAQLDRHRHNLTPIALRACADLALLTPLALLVLPGRLLP
jgi:hypothetical protein